MATIFYSSWDECPTNLWTLPAFSELSTMICDDLTHPVTAAATTQVKFYPYDEEEPHIWFRLIKAKFTAAGDQISKTQIRQCSGHPAQASPSEHSRHNGCLQ
jgi:hypothetical protein